MARPLLTLPLVRPGTVTEDRAVRTRGGTAPVVLAAGLLLLAVLAVVMVLIGARAKGPAQSPVDRGTSGSREALPPDPPAPATEPEPTRLPTGGNLLAPLSLSEARAQELRGELELHGEVRDPAGEPVAGAEIWRDGTRVAVTDAHGRYRFTGLLDPVAVQRNRPRYAPVSAYHPRLGSDTREGPVRSGALDFRLELQATVRGQAWDQETRLPVDDTVVEMWCFPEVPGVPQRRSFQAFTEADGRGAFEFLGVPRGRVALRASAPGYGMLEWRQFVLSGDLLRDAFLEIQETRRIRGRFLPWPPVGVEDARQLRLVVNVPQLLQKDVALHAEDGSFELEFVGRLGVVGIALESERGVLFRKELDEVYSANPADVGTLLIDVPGGLSGRVRCPPEALALGLELRTLPMKGSMIQATDFPLDGNGRFRASPLPDGQVTLGVVAGSHLVAALGLETVRAGEVRELEERPLRDPVVAGLVLAPGGVPCRARAAVELEGRSLPAQEWRLLAESPVDDQGRYVLRPPAARWADLPADLRVTAHLGGRARSSPTALSPGEEVFHRIDLVLRADDPVPGTLLDAGGSPAADWTVVLRDPASGTTAADVTARDGSFLLYGLPPGSYEAAAEPVGGGEIPLGAAAVNELPLMLTLPPR